MREQFKIISRAATAVRTFQTSQKLMLFAFALAGGFVALAGPRGAAAQSATDEPATHEPMDALDQRAAATDWPCWRGSHRDNRSPDASLPLHWSKTENIAWRVEVPGSGHASPCVCGGQIYVSTADENEETQMLLAYDRLTGELQWETELHRGGFMPKHEKNTHASATPACDGQRVYVPMMNSGDLWLSAVDVDGRLAWQTNLGKYQNGNGYGSSPVLYQSLVIVSNDNRAEPSLVGVDAKSGEIVWRTPRQPSSNSATPIVGHVAGRPQLLMNGAGSVSSYDPATGRRLWFVDHETEVAACTMAFDESRVYASGNVPEKEWLCVRADGEGDVADSHVVWRTDQRVTYVPSPLVHDGRLFFVTDSGLAFCLDAATGREIWKHRLPGSFIASPVLAGGNIFATAESGTTFVFRASSKFDELARNELGETCYATPAISGDRLSLRTVKHLYCIGHDRRESKGADAEMARKATAPIR